MERREFLMKQKAVASREGVNELLLEHNAVLLEQNGIYPEHTGILLEHNSVLLEQNAGWDKQKYEEKIRFCMNWVLVSPNRL